MSTVKLTSIASDTTSATVGHNCTTSMTPTIPSRVGTTTASGRPTPSRAAWSIHPRRSMSFCVDEKMKIAPTTAAHHSARFYKSAVTGVVPSSSR